jgi:hypothetical protein
MSEEKFPILEAVRAHFEAMGFHVEIRLPRISASLAFQAAIAQEDHTKRVVIVRPPGQECQAESRVTVDFLKWAEPEPAASALIETLGKALGKLFTEAKEKLDELEGLELTEKSELLDRIECQEKVIEVLRGIEDEDAWKILAREAFENGTCPICFHSEEHGEGCYIRELEDKVESVEKFALAWGPPEEGWKPGQTLIHRTYGRVHVLSWDEYRHAIPADQENWVPVQFANSPDHGTVLPFDLREAPPVTVYGEGKKRLEEGWAAQLPHLKYLAENPCLMDLKVEETQRGRPIEECMIFVYFVGKSACYEDFLVRYPDQEAARRGIEKKESGFGGGRWKARWAIQGRQRNLDSIREEP